MAKPMMLQDKDDKTIEKLKKQMGANTKIEVVREALKLLEKQIVRHGRVLKWKRAAKLASTTSYEVLSEFQAHSRLKKND